ncbi:MAG TPA: hypothetical protein VF458_06820 [Ktedonobacteraceae bacterium]
MAGWEEEKRAAQTAFTFTGNVFQDVHSSIGNTYQQILLTGHIYAHGNDSLTQQITDGMFRDQEQDVGWFGRQHTYELGNEPDQGIEPER